MMKSTDVVTGLSRKISQSYAGILQNFVNFLPFHVISLQCQVDGNREALICTSINVLHKMCLHRENCLVGTTKSLVAIHSIEIFLILNKCCLFRQKVSSSVSSTKLLMKQPKFGWDNNKFLLAGYNQTFCVPNNTAFSV